MKKLILMLAALWSVAASWGADFGIPDGIQQANILHCFNWTFNDIKAELPNIAAAGFGAVQVSPVQGSASTNAEWFYAYMPYDYVFKANGNGSRTQLQTLCQEAAKHNIKVVVDVVANHVNGSSAHRDPWWNTDGRIRYNGGINYGDRNSIINGQLGDYGDCNTARSDVQQRALTFLKDLKSLGVAGIRWDAAKHIGLPSEGDQFWAQMATVAGLWHYGEMLDGPGGDKNKLLKEYTKYIGVSDTEYSKWTREQVCNGQVPTGYGSWTTSGLDGNKIVYWAESHDDYSNDGQYGTNSSQISQDKIDRAYAITACRNAETALYFSRPAATTRNTIKMGQKGSTHFTSKQVAEVNKFRNAMTGTADYYTHSGGVACITRGGGGAVIVVGAGGSRQVSVTNGGSLVPAGTYKDQVSGNTFTVTASTISGQVGSTGIAVVYNPDGVQPNPGPGPEPGPTPTDDWTIYYDNSATAYATVYVHYWGAEESTWPGVQMTPDGTLYKATVPAGTTGLVFNNGNNGQQTEDVTSVANGHIYKGQGPGAKTVCTDLGEYGEPSPYVEMPERLYILGNLEGAQWDTSKGIEMRRDGYEFVATDVTLTAPVGSLDGKAYFTFVTALGADWDAVNMGGDRYGAPGKDLPVNLDIPAPMKKYALNVDASAAESWKIEAGHYAIRANFADMLIMVTNYQGIEAIESETEKAVYYTLQGVQVQTPADPGLYLRRQGTKTTKILIR